MTNNNNSQQQKTPYEVLSLEFFLDFQLVKCNKCGQSFPSESMASHSCRGK